MVVDIQGCKNILFDPKIASKQLMLDKDFSFSTGNLSRDTINTFNGMHQCKIYCELLNFPVLVPSNNSLI